MNYLNLIHFSVFTVRAGPQVGPDRGQAGGGPETTGLVAGPGRALGRATARVNRPQGRPRPGARPAHGNDGAATADGNRRREREKGAGRRAKTERNSPQPIVELGRRRGGRFRRKSAGGDAEEKRGRRRRSRLSHPDSLRGKGEEEATVLVVPAVPCGKEPNDGELGSAENGR